MGSVVIPCIPLALGQGQGQHPRSQNLQTSLSLSLHNDLSFKERREPVQKIAGKPQLYILLEYEFQGRQENMTC